MRFMNKRSDSTDEAIDCILGALEVPIKDFGINNICVARDEENGMLDIIYSSHKDSFHICTLVILVDELDKDRVFEKLEEAGVKYIRW